MIYKYRSKESHNSVDDMFFAFNRSRKDTMLAIYLIPTRVKIPTKTTGENSNK